MIYYIKRFFRQLRRVISWIPVIWKAYDFDYSYAMKFFIKQLGHMADYFEGDGAVTMGAKRNAERMRTAIRLWEKIESEEYAMEYCDMIEEKYGKESVVWEPIEVNGTTMYRMGHKFVDKNYSPKMLKQIEAERHDLFKKSFAKHEKAKRIFWRYLETYFFGFWD